MKAFSDGRLSDRLISRRSEQHTPEKETEGIELPEWSPEELHQTQALIQDLDKQFVWLRETLQGRQLRISRAKQMLSGLQTLLFPPRRRWWRRWLPR
jgi:hypothetical protein